MRHGLRGYILHALVGSFFLNSGCPLKIDCQCDVRFHFWVGNHIIRAPALFIPDEVFAAQFKQPVMNHSVVIRRNGSYMSLYILIPYVLGRVADVLYVAKFRNPRHPGVEKRPDHQLIVVCHVKLLVMTAYGFIKGLPPCPDMIRS